jgi:hypothetical protein
MKKLSFLIAGIILLVSVQSFAQTRFGIKAGLNLANVAIKSQGVTVTPSTLTSFHAGFLVDVALGNVGFIQPGVLVTGKGLKVKSNNNESTSNPIYVEIPINLGARFELAENVKLYVMGGPYIGFGIAGKAKNGSNSVNLKFGNGTGSDYRPLDIGLNIGTGLDINGFLLGVQYGLGLSNLVPDGNSNSSATNRVFSISLAYLFEGK